MRKPTVVGRCHHRIASQIDSMGLAVHYEEAGKKDVLRHDVPHHFMPVIALLEIHCGELGAAPLSICRLSPDHDSKWCRVPI